ncbi:MAG: hypothetical protein Q9227_006593 [Pyrenula ochraceoflavens]
MASGGDARDLMGISGPPSSGPPPAKKVKGTPAPRVTGINREIQALQGDHAPPIPINQVKYKSKPAFMNKAFKPRHYELRPFQNAARNDGLWLKHWKPKRPPSDGTAVKGSQQPKQEGDDVDMGGARDQDIVLRYDDEFPMEKFNIHVDVPTYNDEEYELLLKSEDWTKQETDYLMELCKEFDLRWFVVVDRYDRTEIPLPPHIENSKTDGDSMAVDSIEEDTPYHDRSLEDLKARYYYVYQKMFEQRVPLKEMNQQEYTNWELAKKFDFSSEKSRKKIAEALFSRDENEAMEEQLLLAELKKILKDEDDWLVSRNDLLGRIDMSLTRRRLPDDESHAFERSSTGLSQTLQHLLQKERALKQGSRRALDGSAGPAPSNGGGPSWEKGSHPNQYTRRNTQQTIDDVAQTPTAGPQKKGSTAATPSIRQLTPAEEVKYGVTHHTERITSGVSFRGERANRATVAKSQAQTQKIQGALAHLNVPLRLVMPTEKVCRTFEQLIGEISLLLDVRKHAEKVNSEVQVLEGVRRRRLGEEDPEESKDAEASGDAEPATGDDNASRDVAMGDAAQKQHEAGSSPHQRIGEINGAHEEDVDDENELENMEDSKIEPEDEEREDRTSIPEASSDHSGQNGEENEDGENGEENDAAQDEDNEDEEDIGVGLGEDNEDDEDAEFQAEPEVEQDSEAEAEDEADGDDEDAAPEAAEEEEEAEREDEEDGDEEAPEDDGEEDEQQPEEEDAVGEVDDDGSADENGSLKASTLSSAAHKRSASVISEVSRTGSNRSGAGRKKRK